MSPYSRHDIMTVVECGLVCDIQHNSVLTSRQTRTAEGHGRHTDGPAHARVHTRSVLGLGGDENAKIEKR